ncbi:MAG: TauD/TfdA family dioxygenase [Gammaproteobacteria bacterium]|nr:TauD/TfdA family dioxygenase [Gammaproteobacteria bacterium]
MHITPVNGKVFGAIVTELALDSLTDEAFDRIREAFLEYGFLLFPRQFLTDESSAAFGARFGELEFAASPMSNQERRPDGDYGRIYGLNTQRMRTNVGNEAWHTDSTYKPVSSKCAMLSAVKVPATGGETELADMRAGYAALDAATKDRIGALSAYHSTQYSQANDVGDFPPQDENSIYHGEAYLRPLVKVHPETGVKNLFVGRHAFGIPGLPREESRKLLRGLVDFVVSDAARVYSHKWRPGDTLLWDNRALLHRAKPYDYGDARVLIGTRVAGDPATELAYYPTDPAARAGRDALKAELTLLRREVNDRRYGGTTAAVGERASGYAG